jgi:RNA polymerase sigma factor (sigma-70 family)
MKDYRIEVKVKNNILYRLMKKRGIETPAQLSRLSGVGLPTVYNYMNLKDIPYTRQGRGADAKLAKGEFKESVLKLAEFLSVTPYEMFPLQHLDKPLLTNKAESELSFEEITQYILPGGDKPLLEDGLYGPEQKVYEVEKHDAISEMLKTLTKKEETAVRGHFGLDSSGKSLKEIGEELGDGGCLSRENVRQTVKRALRKLRHPTLGLRKYRESQ